MVGAIVTKHRLLLRPSPISSPAGRPYAVVATGLNGKRITVSAPSLARCSFAGAAWRPPGLTR